MKKYLYAFIPFVVCTLISLVFYFSKTKDYPDPSYPYRTQEYMIYFTNRWFWIGIIFTVLAIIGLGIEDIFDYLDKRRKRKYYQ